MLQGVLSSRFLPACPLRSGRRPAARSQQGTRAAASPADSGFETRRLRLVLEDLGKTLQAPEGIDKGLALGHLRRAEGELVVLQAKLEVAEMSAAAKTVSARAQEAKEETSRLLMQALVVDYLDLLGDLSPPLGLFEYAEEKLFPTWILDPPKDRLSRWQQLGRRHPGLEDCILAANPSWQADLIPAKNLGNIDCVRKVLLAEGPLSPEDMRFLECLADAVYCPCVLRYKHVAAGTWGQ